VSGKDLSGVAQFIFHAGDPAWDISQFISLGLKSTHNNRMASAIAKEFLKGYMSVRDPSNITRLAKSNRYVESFYSVLVHSIAQTIKKEKAIAN
jgi:hypothetical protein